MNLLLQHAMALTVDGRVFSWGEGDDGKLGHCSKLSVEKPRVIEALRNKRVREDIQIDNN